MNKEKKWKKYEIKNYIVRYLYYRRSQFSEMIFGHEYWPLPKYEAGKKLLSIEKTNKTIKEAIIAGKPYWVGRIGGTEMNMIFEFLKHEVFPEYDNRKDATRKLCEYSGFFPDDIEYGERFVNLMLECCKNIDMQAAWGRYMADYLFDQYQPDTVLTRLDRIEPWNLYKTKSNISPWSSALKGKKVLVIHPFEETIREQYKINRNKIFQNIYEADEILPEFELITIKAVQTLAGEKDDRFASWFEALDWMIEKCSRLEFDVAIIGCGAYGFPLANEIKKMGKVAIHLAGATQLMFGIVGKRWEEEYIYSDFKRNVINPYWVRPSSTEIIGNASNIENACYW